MNTRTSLALVLSTLALIAVAPGCGTGSDSQGTVAEGTIHPATQEERDFLKRTEPLSADRVVLHVNGMGCPLCVTNVDMQLYRLKGVEKVQVDLGAGTVSVDLTGDKRPSPAQLEHAVADAGNTLAKIVIPQ
jgi:copper chaperone CopZ